MARNRTEKLEGPNFHPAEPAVEQVLEEPLPLEGEKEDFEEDLNPGTGRNFDLAALVLCLVGIAISGYLTYTHFAHANIICASGNSCEVVNNSKYAYFLDQPVALLGLLFYSGLLVVTGVRAGLTNRSDENSTLLRGRLDLLLFLMGLSGVAFTAYLKAMEIFVIGAICTWCVGSAVTIAALFALYTIRLLRA